MFYLAHRLFAAHDRALAAMVASQLATVVGGDDVFLPFGDTDQEDLVADPKGRRLFELDRERLDDMTGLLALLHGPSLDDGVCLEVGYAAALGAPIVLMTTDFLTYGNTADAAGWELPDPLLTHLATEIIHVPTLGPLPADASADEPADRFTVFARRNQHQLADAARLACDRLVALSPRASSSGASSPRSLASEAPSPGRDRTAPRPATAYLEPSPYRPLSEAAEVADLLRGRGYQVSTATRFRAQDPRSAAVADWDAALAAELVVADVSGPEAPPGAAAMIGAAAATGRTALAWQPVPSWTFAPGREPNWRNLMVQYAVGGMFRDTAGLRALMGT